MNATRETPLHTLLAYSRPGNHAIVQRLCDADAHLKLRLKCVCARLIQKCEIPYDSKLTPSLLRFVKLH